MMSQMGFDVRQPFDQIPKMVVLYWIQYFICIKRLNGYLNATNMCENKNECDEILKKKRKNENVFAITSIEYINQQCLDIQCVK